MKSTLFSLFAAPAAVLMLAPAFAGAAVPPAEEQIAAAILAAPEDRRAGAGVLGYNEGGKVVTLRKGTNEILCLADDPAAKGFSAACYHKDLEPFMARGRELTDQGVKGEERHKIRAKEVEDGKVKMPREARTLYVLTGKQYQPATGTVEDAYLRWVIYVPFATPESTGLPTKAQEGAPWLMAPGTAGAHIMISPPRPKK